jgi:hypothetical protein
VAGAWTVIAGFGGELISHAYVEEQLGDTARIADLERRLAKWWRIAARALGPASSTRAIFDVAVAPLLELLRHGAASTAAEAYGLRGQLASSNTILLVVPWDQRPASSWREAIRLGLAAGSQWAIISNGQSLRIADCTRTWSRAGVEFDFERLLAGPRGPAALWALASAAALSGAGPGSLRSRVNDSDAHALRVCRSLSDGVLSSLPVLAGALVSPRSRRAVHATALDQSLTLVYRVLFLLFAEARALVPIWHQVYRDAYTIGALTQRATEPSARGLWTGLQAISRLAHSGCKAGNLEVTAFNGRLFSPRHAPLMEQRRVPDAVVRDLLLSLATQATPHGRRRISYHDLGVEQLGSVYERVLEYEPAARSSTAALARTSTRRKSTGSFYTPRALTEFLVRRTLSPLVDGRSADQILSLRVLDPAMGSGAFLVAACRFLSECCEQAMVRDGQWVDADITLASRATIRRNVAERCLYGVDRNPTAVQLARLSLWLTTLAADRPLTFLDHHLASGNSLIGARLLDLSRPLASRRPARAAATLPLLGGLIADDLARHVLPARFRIAMQPSDSLDVVKGKERALAAIARPGGSIAKWTSAADAWCAARLWNDGPAPSSGVVSEWIAASLGLATTMPDRRLRESLARARAVADGHAVFHWELSFPEVFLDDQGHPDAGGGFDAVIGNPPWDMLRADTGSSTQRSDERSTTAALMRFCRSSQIYRHQGAGHPNSYQLFLERALQLTRPGGRVGLVLPSGIATDHGSAALRRHLFDRTAIDTWLGFDNRARIFPIHRSMRFVVLSASNAGCTETLRFRCGLTDAQSLDRETDTPPLAIARSRLEAWSPEHLTIPEISSATSLGIIASIAERVPSLSDPSGWQVRFGRELNATDDRPHFLQRAGARQPLLPVVEGKQVTPFHVDLERSASGVAIETAKRLIDPSASFERDRIAYRDVAGATNKLTLIAAMLPRGTISTHTLFCLKTALGERSQWCLLALMNSFVANYLVRLQVTTHVTTSLVARLPVPRPRDSSPEFARLADLARTIANSQSDETSALAEINALAAQLYGISRDDYAFILATFPLIEADLRSVCLSTYVRATEARNHGGKNSNAL